VKPAAASLALLLLCAVLPVSGAGQQTDTVGVDTASADPVHVLEGFMEQERAREATQPPRAELPTTGTLQALAALDSASAAAYLEALRGLYTYQAGGFLHRARVFRWQLYSSMVIFAIVHLLVIAGLYFSWMQFQKGTEETASEVEFSGTSIKMRSSVLGVIILVISLAFFYLYLVYVYPIEELF
jgi:hypothetical protein